jgi:hypothetical protein
LQAFLGFNLLANQFLFVNVVPKYYKFATFFKDILVGFLSCILMTVLNSSVCRSILWPSLVESLSY